MFWVQFIKINMCIYFIELITESSVLSFILQLTPFTNLPMHYSPSLLVTSKLDLQSKI